MVAHKKESACGPRFSAVSVRNACREASGRNERERHQLLPRRSFLFYTMAEHQEQIQKVARWSGLIASLLVLLVGIVNIATSNAHCKWPADGFTDDVNYSTWRMALFTFEPSVFVDKWTPIFFGLIGTFCHYVQFDLKIITRNFIRFFVFHVISGLFACIGYCGGLGILCSVVVWFTCLMSLIAGIMNGDAQASLELSMSRCQKV